MLSLLQKLSGYKTYIVCAATVLYAGIGWALGQLDTNVAVGMALGGTGLGALRHGVSTGALNLAAQVAPIVLDALKKSAEDAKKAAPVLALMFLGGLSVAGCQVDPTTGQPELTPTGQKIVTVLCAVDQVGQPIAVQVAPTLVPQVTAAASIDQALVHPAVVNACAKALAGSKPVGVQVTAPAEPAAAAS